MTDDPNRPAGPPSGPPAGPTPQELMAARRKLRGGVEEEGAERAPAAASPDRAVPQTPTAPLEVPSPSEPEPEPLRVANCSGFYGDRLSAAWEMVTGGPIDVLTGDWLAELTMLILAKGRLEHPDLGFATTFLTQMEQVLGTCLAEGIVVVSNAGGLNPAGCAEALTALAARLGLTPKVAYVHGDDLLGRLDELAEAGVELRNLDTGESLADLGASPLTANAYLGGWGICQALDHDADVVITGRVTDAALVLGPAASRFGWDRTDWDRLAGAVVAGHVLECGTQCTGGNYAFFTEVPGLERPGFPLAEIHQDGSFVVTKHPGTGGQVSVDTVTAQLLYEIQGPGYYNPDVVVAFDSIRLTEDGPDRVRRLGRRGPAGAQHDQGGGELPGRLPQLNHLGAHRSRHRGQGRTGRAHAVVVDTRRTRQLREHRRDPAAHRPARIPTTNADAIAELTITVMDGDETKVGRAFSNVAIEMALASYPGLFSSGPPTRASSYGVYWPSLVPADVVRHEVVMGEQRWPIEPGRRARGRRRGRPRRGTLCPHPAEHASRHGEPRRADHEDRTRAHRGRTIRGQGGQRQHRAVGSPRRGLRVAGRPPDRGPAPPTPLGRDRWPGPAPLRAGKPAGHQHRHRGAAGSRGGGLHPDRPPGQGPGRVPPGQAGGRPHPPAFARGPAPGRGFASPERATAAQLGTARRPAATQRARAERATSTGTRLT